MKKNFWEYYELSSEELKKLVDESFIVLDTNVFINFYRYSSATTSKFFEILESLQDKLWIPYQIGKEFHKNRIDEILSQKKIYKDSKGEVMALKSKFEDKNRNPFISHANFVLFDNLIKELDEASNRFDSLLDSDTTLIKINNLFDDKIGDDLTPEQLGDLFKEGKDRYRNKIPPGFADEKDKPEEIRKYGDLIIWKQMINNAKVLNRNCIFITDDRKNDWWFIDKNNSIQMPLPELRKEFHQESNYSYYSFQPFSFLEFIKDEFQFEIKQEIIEEVKDMRTSNVPESQVEFIFVRELKDGGINNLESALLANGYQIEIYLGNTSGVYILAVHLPNIPDIGRRFHSDFKEFLQSFSLELVAEDSY